MQEKVQAALRSARRRSTSCSPIGSTSTPRRSTRCRRTKPRPDFSRALADALEALPEWSGDAAKEAIGATATAQGAKPGQLMFPTRVALSGRSAGPDLGAMLEILGREESVKRIRACGGGL